MTHERKNHSAAARVILMLLTAMTLAFILGSSLLSSEDSIKQSDTVSYFISKSITQSPSQTSESGEPAEKSVAVSFIEKYFLLHVRKTAHFLEFVLLAAELTLIGALYVKRSRGALIQGGFNILSAGLFTAFISEALQIIADRGPSVSDILLDMSGFITGMTITAVGVFITRIIRKRGSFRSDS